MQLRKLKCFLFFHRTCLPPFPPSSSVATHSSCWRGEICQAKSDIYFHFFSPLLHPELLLKTKRNHLVNIKHQHKLVTFIHIHWSYFYTLCRSGNIVSDSVWTLGIKAIIASMGHLYKKVMCAMEQFIFDEDEWLIQLFKVFFQKL